MNMYNRRKITDDEEGVIGRHSTSKQSFFPKKTSSSFFSCSRLLCCGTCGCFFVLIVVLLIGALLTSYVKNLASQYDPDSFKLKMIEIFKTSFASEVVATALRESMKQTDRVWLLDEINSDFKNPILSAKQLIVDVSGFKEFSFITRHMQASKSYRHFCEKELQACKTVVDIGAFDGISTSNSYNFIQAGFNALVVEPSPMSFTQTKSSLLYFDTPGSKQKIHMVNAAVSDVDGVAILRKTERTGSRNHLIHESRDPLENEHRIVTYSVPSLMRKFNIPNRFGVLSVDAEGMNQQILVWFLNAGYYPQYIIVERFTSDGYNPDPKKYQQLSCNQFNCIFEYVAASDT